MAKKDLGFMPKDSRAEEGLREVVKIMNELSDVCKLYNPFHALIAQFLLLSLTLETMKTAGNEMFTLVESLESTLQSLNKTAGDMGFDPLGFVANKVQ